MQDRSHRLCKDFEIWLDHNGSDKSPVSEHIESFEKSYRVIYDSERAYAEELAEELGYISAMEKAGVSANYFDFAQFAYDLFINDVWGEYDLHHHLHIFQTN